MRVPKEQLTEIQQAERVDRREWWEEVEGGVKEGGGADEWRTVTGRERRQEAGCGAGLGVEGGGAQDGQEVVYWGKRDGSNWVGEERKAAVREVERNFSYWRRKELTFASRRESRYLPRLRASTSAIMAAGLWTVVQV